MQGSGPPLSNRAPVPQHIQTFSTWTSKAVQDCRQSGDWHSTEMPSFYAKIFAENCMKLKNLD